MSSKKISILIPVYNALETLDELVNQCEINIKSITQDFEIIFIDDYSTDKSWEKIKNISKKNIFIKGLKLIKNFGVDTAITEGLKESSGEYVYIITCDLTDPLDKMFIFLKFPPTLPHTGLSTNNQYDPVVESTGV